MKWPNVGRRVLQFAFAVSVTGVAFGQVTAKPRPVPGPEVAPVFPKITVDTLANGLRLAIVENHALPLVAVRVGFAGTTYLDAPGKEGEWVLMTTLLREGTSMRSGTSLADASADLGTPIIWSGLGFPSLTTVRSAWKSTVELLADMLVNPTFPTDAFTRVQAAQAAAAARVLPTAAANRVLNAALYGQDHVYARSATTATIRALTRDDIVEMQKKYLRPQNTTIVVAGDVTPAEARTVVENAFASWTRTGVTVDSNIPGPTSPAGPTTIYLRDDPGAALATVYTGLIVPSRGDAHAPAIEAVNTVLGGTSGGGRIWQAFRVDRGLSYSPRTLFVWRPAPQVSGWYGLATNLVAAKTDTAVMEWLRVVRETHGDRPLTTQELDFARRNLVGALPAQMETVDLVATTTLTLLQNGLPETFYADYVRRVNAVTLAQFQDAAAKYLDPDHLVIAVVGDRSKIEAPLRATGIPVVIVP